MLLSTVFNSMNALLKEQQAGEILKVNEVSEAYGLRVTREEAKEIIEVRDRILQSCGRIELSNGTTTKLLQAFCESPFIQQENYVSTIHELHELFYYFKNETEDSLGDEPVVDLLKELFNGSCGGSTDMMKGMLETFADTTRRENQRLDYLAEGEEK